METGTAAAALPPPPNNDSDSKASLRHILAPEPQMDDSPPEVATVAASPPDDQQYHDADSTQSPPDYDQADKPAYTSNPTSTRRNANGSVSSVYSGNKIRHLKKEDGVPLWRKDIQYDFLRHVFEDDHRVFHKVSDGAGGAMYTFADIYLDAMANSSKCSKILKDKLLSERPAAVNMAMVCLLVNVGRMNTTLNFFPEMRAQLRTYHSIPSLQAHQDPNAYKQLQDAPRLKSILKGATEDVEQPSTIDDIKAQPIPRTNPVNLIFVLSQYAPKISEIHFNPPRDFFDLVMRSNLSSRSRATAFLWLMWWYLESSFTADDALNNPFGPGEYPAKDDSSTDGLPIKCPAFEFLTPDMEARENVDTEEERTFGEIKRVERQAILQSDMAPVVTGPKRTNKKAFNQNPVFSVMAEEGLTTPGRGQSPSHGSARGRGKLAKSIIERDYPSDTEHTRSASPPGSISNTHKKATPSMRINTVLNDDGPVSTPASNRVRSTWNRSRAGGGSARTFKSKLDVNGNTADVHSPAVVAPAVSSYSGPHGFYLPLNGADPSHKRTRPLTAHQLAVEKFRRRRVDVILDRGLREEYVRAAKRRRLDGGFRRAWIRCKGMRDGYDTDEESYIQERQQADIEVGRKTPPPMFAGLMPLDYGGEVNDYGEEAYVRSRVLKRTLRRLERWDNGGEVQEKGKSKGGAGADANGFVEQDGDDDEEMQDVAESDEDENEFDGNTLPPLSRLV